MKESEKTSKIKITELDDKQIPRAKKLVDEVFKYQDFTERISFWVYKHRHKFWIKFLSWWYGALSLEYWVAVDENGTICGTTGLYSMKKDFDEAIWLSWFCVAPTRRGQGIGKRLIEFSIEEARRRGKKYLRLYTSDDSNEAEAQFLYEKYGFVKTGEEKHDRWTLFYREKVL